MSCRESVVNPSQIKSWFSWSFYSSMGDRQKASQPASQTPDSY